MKTLKTYKKANRNSDEPFLTVLSGSLYVSQKAKPFVFKGNPKSFDLQYDEDTRAIVLVPRKDREGIIFHAGYAGVTLHRIMPKGRYELQAYTVNSFLFIKPKEK